jgi:hypothetical protein
MSVLRLYKIERPNKAEYDEFEAAIVCAISPSEARKIHPRAGSGFPWNNQYDIGMWDLKASDVWVAAEDVKVTYVGLAAKSLVPGVVLSDFNAG